MPAHSNKSDVCRCEMVLHPFLLRVVLTASLSLSFGVTLVIKWKENGDYAAQIITTASIHVCQFSVLDGTRILGKTCVHREQHVWTSELFKSLEHWSDRFAQHRFDSST